LGPRTDLAPNGPFGDEPLDNFLNFFSPPSNTNLVSHDKCALTRPPNKNLPCDIHVLTPVADRPFSLHRHPPPLLLLLLNSASD
jgi:hypothetical protein